MGHYAVVRWSQHFATDGRDEGMKTKKHGIYVPDRIVLKAMSEDLILFGIESAKAMSIKHFGEMLDHTIDLCILDAFGVPREARYMNNAARIIEALRGGTIAAVSDVLREVDFQEKRRKG